MSKEPPPPPLSTHTHTHTHTIKHHIITGYFQNDCVKHCVKILCCCECVCVVAIIYYVAGVRVTSNGSSIDQVFEEEDESEDGERRPGGRGRLGVEPVLATSYSANDVSHLHEEEIATSFSNKKMVVPR